MIKLLFIGFGGAVGAISRALLSSMITKLFPTSSFPWGILICNVLGCFILGFLATYFLENIIPNHHKAMIIVGMLGSFTTFSTFSMDTINLIMDQQFISAILNVTLSVVLGLVFVFLGILLAKSIS